MSEQYKNVQSRILPIVTRSVVGFSFFFFDIRLFVDKFLQFLDSVYLKNEWFFLICMILTGKSLNVDFKAIAERVFSQNFYMT